MKKVIYVAIAFALLVAGFYLAYDRAKELNTARCWGCIAMQPKAEKFTNFWIEYPEGYKAKGIPPHPDWIINASKEKVVMLFFWGPACEPCEKQWEDMKKAGLVIGSEENGTITQNFSYVKLFSLDVTKERGNTIKIYTKDGSESTPTTVILFEKNGTIYWYAFSGRADGKGGRPSIEELINILEKAKEEKYGSL